MSENYMLVDTNGKATEIEGETKIGRSKTNDIVLKDPLASRHHSTVYLDGDVLMIRDEQSVNGTIVNRGKIYEPVVLKDRDTIQFGDEVFTVRAPLAEAKTVLKSEKEIEEMAAGSGKKKAKRGSETSKAAPEVSKKLKKKSEAPPKKASEPTPTEESLREELKAEEAPKKDNKSKVLIIVGVAMVALCLCSIVLVVILRTSGVI